MKTLLFVSAPAKFEASISRGEASTTTIGGEARSARVHPFAWLNKNSVLPSNSLMIFYLSKRPVK